MKTKCPTVLSIAIVLLILASLLFWLTAFLFPDPSRDSSPPVVLYGSVVLGLLGLIAAFGVFNLKRWGMWLSIGVSVFSALFGVGGIANSSLPLTKGLCIVLIALYALIIVLVILPSSRAAYVAERMYETLE